MENDVDQSRQTTIARNPYGDLTRGNIAMNASGAASIHPQFRVKKNRRSISMGRKDDQQLHSGASTFMSRPDQSTTADH